MVNFTEMLNNMVAGNPARGTLPSLKGNVEEDMFNLGLPNSEEGMIAMGLTYAAADVEGTSANRAKVYGGHDEITVTAKFPRNYVPEKDGSAVKRGPDHMNGDKPKYLPARASEDDYGEYGVGNINDCPDPEMAQLFRTVVSGKEQWFYHLFMLHGTSEVKDLTPSQLKSYFKWQKSSGVEGELISKILPKIVVGLGAVITEAAVRNRLGNDKWVEYRLTFSTGGLLIAKMLDECPADYLKVFSPATQTAIRRYKNSTFDQALYRAIPEKALGIAYAYLKETDQLVGELWSMKRAYEKMTIQEKTSLSNWFKEAKGKFKVYKGGKAFKGEMPRSVMNV